MNGLAPLETLYEMNLDRAMELPLPPELDALYGRLRFPPHPNRTYVIGNFVTTLDGVVSLNIPGQSGGGEISGFYPHDRMVMGLLRAVADAVIVGAGTVRAVSPSHVWTADYVYPSLANAYQSVRSSMGKSGPPLNVIVTARGELDLSQRVFQSGQVPVLIVTTTQGAQRIGQQELPQSVQIAAVESVGPLSARTILDTVGRALRGQDNILLVEGGPQLMGDFFAAHCLDELFLTLAPQIAGRDSSLERPGLITGKRFAPEHPLWGELVGVKQAGNHLFLRYAFESAG
ncbi:MAG: dihydrofolate reductase family protein [Anaerolineales bacterium]